MQAVCKTQYGRVLKARTQTDQKQTKEKVAVLILDTSFPSSAVQPHTVIDVFLGAVSLKSYAEVPEVIKTAQES